MREIKFRAWNGKQMVSPDYIDRKGVAHWKENSIPESSPKIMQYTGFSVKGKDIYEGDILSGKWAVEWDNERGFWVVFNPSQHYCALGEALYNVPELEVVGNIYENIELWEMDEDE